MSNKSETTTPATDARHFTPACGSESDTPRTDREAKDVDRFGFTLETVRARFARELERENIGLQKDRARLEWLIENIHLSDSPWDLMASREVIDAAILSQNVEVSDGGGQ